VICVGRKNYFEYQFTDSILPRAHFLIKRSLRPSLI
jgi:hypothetical protein